MWGVPSYCISKLFKALNSCSLISNCTLCVILSKHNKNRLFLNYSYVPNVLAILTVMSSSSPKVNLYWKKKLCLSCLVVYRKWKFLFQVVNFIYWMRKCFLKNLKLQTVRPTIYSIYVAIYSFKILHFVCNIFTRFDYLLIDFSQATKRNKLDKH